MTNNNYDKYIKFELLIKYTIHTYNTHLYSLYSV